MLLLHFKTFQNIFYLFIFYCIVLENFPHVFSIPEVNYKLEPSSSALLSFKERSSLSPQPAVLIEPKARWVLSAQTGEFTSSLTSEENDDPTTTLVDTSSVALHLNDQQLLLSSTNSATLHAICVRDTVVVKDRDFINIPPLCCQAFLHSLRQSSLTISSICRLDPVKKQHDCYLGMKPNYLKWKRVVGTPVNISFATWPSKMSETCEKRSMADLVSANLLQNVGSIKLSDDLLPQDNIKVIRSERDDIVLSLPKNPISSQDKFSVVLGLKASSELLSAKIKGLLVHRLLFVRIHVLADPAHWKINVRQRGKDTRFVIRVTRMDAYHNTINPKPEPLLRLELGCVPRVNPGVDTNSSPSDYMSGYSANHPRMEWSVPNTRWLRQTGSSGLSIRTTSVLLPADENKFLVVMPVVKLLNHIHIGHLWPSPLLLPPDTFRVLAVEPKSLSVLDLTSSAQCYPLDHTVLRCPGDKSTSSSTSKVSFSGKSTPVTRTVLVLKVGSWTVRSVPLRLWVPEDVRIHLRDSVLNRVRDWRSPTPIRRGPPANIKQPLNIRNRRTAEVKRLETISEEDVSIKSHVFKRDKRKNIRQEKKRRKKKKKQQRVRPSTIHCSRRFQQTRLRISARFYYTDPKSNHKVYLNKYNNQTGQSHRPKTPTEAANIDRFDLTAVIGDRLAAAWMGNHVIELVGSDLEGWQVIGREQGVTRVVLLNNPGGWTSHSKVVAWTRVSVSNRAVSLVDIEAKVIKRFQVSRKSSCVHCLSFEPSLTYATKQSPGTVPNTAWKQRLATTLIFDDASSLSFNDVASSDLVSHVVPALTAPGDWQLIISQPELCPRARDLLAKTFDWLHDDGRLIIWRLRNQTRTSSGPLFVDLSTIDPRDILGLNAYPVTTPVSGNTSIHHYRPGGSADDLRLSNDESIRPRLRTPSGELGPLRLGMYVLLGVFCTALAVFAVNCAIMLVVRRSSTGCSSDPLPGSTLNVDVGFCPLPNAVDAETVQSVSTPILQHTIRSEHPYALYQRLSTFQRGTNGMRITPNPLHCESEDELECELPIGPTNGTMHTEENSSCISSSSCGCDPPPSLEPVDINSENAQKHNWDYDSMPMSYDQLLTDFLTHIKQKPPVLDHIDNYI